MRYRVGGGRGAPMRRHTIGSRQQISLATARRIAAEVLAKARAGQDPAGERRAASVKAKNEARAQAQSVVDGYIDHLRSDGVVAAIQIASLLRRELLEPRAANATSPPSLVPSLWPAWRSSQRVAGGASRRCFVLASTGSFHGRWIMDLFPPTFWPASAVAEGTRAQMLEAATDTRTGRMLAMDEIAALWAATLDPAANP